MKKIVFILLLLVLCIQINAGAIPTTGTFTPIATPNQAPVQSNHLIWNGLAEKSLNATDVNVSLSSINFTIADPNGNSMDWYIYHNNSGTWELIDSDTGVSNGTVVTTDVSWFDRLTNYSISFNVTDNNLWKNETYWFVTDYSVPQFSNVDPTNGSTVATASYDWHIDITDLVLFNWTIECSNGQNSSGNDNTNNTFYLNLTGLATQTLYTILVNATNGNKTNNASYIFTVTIPSEPDSQDGGGGGASGLLVEILIVDIVGNPVGTQTVSVYQNGNLRDRAITNLDGKAKFLLPPGKYQARTTIGNETRKVDFEVKPDEGNAFTISFKKPDYPIIALGIAEFLFLCSILSIFTILIYYKRKRIKKSLKTLRNKYFIKIKKRN